MNVTKQELAAMRQKLFGRARDQRAAGHPEFRVRPISEAWDLFDKAPAYKTATANCAYIWRDSEPTDRFGPMPRAFAERRCELRGAGVILPASAPAWAVQGYTIWQEADQAASATGNPAAVSAWHLILEIPLAVPGARWKALVTEFVQREIASRGRCTAWAIHALEGAEGWIEKPHCHLVVTALGWRHDARYGRRALGGVGSWGGQRALDLAWRRACSHAQAWPFKKDCRPAADVRRRGIADAGPPVPARRGHHASANLTNVSPKVCILNEIQEKPYGSVGDAACSSR